MRIIRAFFEYLAAFIIIFLLLFAIASVVVVKFFGDEVQDYAMELLNEGLDTKISIEEAGISVIKKFPNTSVYFSNVIIWSGHKYNRDEFSAYSTDTLFYAERLFAQFNLLDLIRKKYTIKNLEAKNGELRIFIDSKGKGNYLLESNKNPERKENIIEMKGISIRGFNLQYVNIAKEISANALLKDIDADGNFSKRNYLLSVSGSAFLQNFTNHGINYVKNSDLETDLRLDVNENHISILKGEIILGELVAGISGNILIDKNVGADLDVQLVGKRIDINWVSDILTNTKITPEGFSSKGSLDVKIKVNGLLTARLTPHIEAVFLTRNASLIHNKTSLNVKSLSLEGSYTNGTLNGPGSSKISLDKFNAVLDNSLLNGSLIIEDLLAPTYNLNLYGEVSVIDLTSYFEDIPVDISSGIIKPKMNLSGSIGIGNSGINSISYSPIGTVEISNLSFSPSSSSFEFQSINSQLTISSSAIEGFISGFIEETDFELNISLIEPFNYLKSKAPIQIEGGLYISSIDLDKLLKEVRNEKIGDNAFEYPQNISANLDFTFDEIIKQEIKSKKVSGKLIYDYPAIVLESIQMETMEGSISARAALSDLNLPIHNITFASTFDDVNIREVFKSFNNFRQDFISFKNIAGSISGNTEFRASLNQNYSLNSSSIVSNSSFIINNGELRNFEPLIELSKFLKIDRMDEVAFSKLENTILISNSKITIPHMDINSSALNIQASGIHAFDKTYEYHLATKLSEILFNKAKSSKNKEFDIALDKNDDRTIFLVLYNKGEGMVVDFDEAQAMQKIRNDLKSEKTELKVILNEEFGIFDKDEDVKKEIEKVEEPVLRFDFNDETEADTSSIDTKVRSRWWKKKEDAEKKEDLKFIIDDEYF